MFASHHSHPGIVPAKPYGTSFFTSSIQDALLSCYRAHVFRLEDVTFQELSRSRLIQDVAPKRVRSQNLDSVSACVKVNWREGGDAESRVDEGTHDGLIEWNPIQYNSFTNEMTGPPRNVSDFSVW
jgi:hypothetical protein